MGRKKTIKGVKPKTKKPSKSKAVVEVVAPDEVIIPSYEEVHEITHPKKSAMIAALKKTMGIVSTACVMVGISNKTYYNWIDSDESFKSAANDIENYALDFVESQLHENIAEKDTASILFYLKTKGKKRGFVERTEHVIASSHDDFIKGAKEPEDE